MLWMVDASIAFDKGLDKRATGQVFVIVSISNAPDRYKAAEANCKMIAESAGIGALCARFRNGSSLLYLLHTHIEEQDQHATHTVHNSLREDPFPCV
ncbi:unnamed protein product [Caretta caretta]